MTRHTAKALLKNRGIAQTAAAKKLGVTFEHLNRVLNGHRQSRRILRDIGNLKMDQVSQ